MISVLLKFLLRRNSVNAGVLVIYLEDYLTPKDTIELGQYLLESGKIRQKKLEAAQ